MDIDNEQILLFALALAKDEINRKDALALEYQKRIKDAGDDIFRLQEDKQRAEMQLAKREQELDFNYKQNNMLKQQLEFVTTQLVYVHASQSDVEKITLARQTLEHIKSFWERYHEL